MKLRENLTSFPFLGVPYCRRSFQSYVYLLARHLFVVQLRPSAD